ncbi:MAG: hypothetical protein ACT4NY_13400 [Pseudonocardiales bacterium]
MSTDASRVRNWLAGQHPQSPVPELLSELFSEKLGYVLVRATTDPGGLDPPTHLNLSDPAAIEQEGRAWLAKVWARTEVREALRLASPTFGARIDQLPDDGAGPDSVKELRRAILSVASYLLNYRLLSCAWDCAVGLAGRAAGAQPAPPTP